MKNEVPNTITAVDVVPKLVSLLLPLSNEDRQKAIAATMILLGQPVTAMETPTSFETSPDTINSGNGISAKGMGWMNKAKITRDQLDHIFSIEDGEVDVIAARMPGKSKAKQTVQAYILCGLKSYLMKGDTVFLDQDARELCQKVGCYDSPNHFNYTKTFKNLIAGSKDSGWKLTNPGLSEAANLVKGLVGDNNT